MACAFKWGEKCFLLCSPLQTYIPSFIFKNQPGCPIPSLNQFPIACMISSFNTIAVFYRTWLKKGTTGLSYHHTLYLHFLRHNSCFISHISHICHISASSRRKWLSKMKRYWVQRGALANSEASEWAHVAARSCLRACVRAIKWVNPRHKLII